MYSDSVSLKNLLIDNNIIYRDFANTASPYTYVNKIIELNRSRLCAAFQLTSIMVDYDTYSLKLVGSSVTLVQQALVCISNMLQGPVYSLRVDPELVIAMRVLKYVKTDFSSKTGCWLHFIWASETVTCYGLDGKAAEDYLMTTLSVLKGCKLPGYSSADGRILVERLYSRHVRKFIKKNVDDIEARTGALVAVKSNNASSMGTVVVQFYGIAEGVEEACRMIEREVGFGAIPGSTDFQPMSPESLKSFPRSVSTGDALSLQLAQLHFPHSSSLALSDAGLTHAPITASTTACSFPSSASTSSLMSHSPYLSRTTVDTSSGEIVTIAGGLQPEITALVTSSGSTKLAEPERVGQQPAYYGSGSSSTLPNSTSTEQMQLRSRLPPSSSGGGNGTGMFGVSSAGGVPRMPVAPAAPPIMPSQCNGNHAASTTPPPQPGMLPSHPPPHPHPQARNLIYRAALETDVPFHQLINFLKAVDGSGVTIQDTISLLASSTASY